MRREQPELVDVRIRLTDLPSLRWPARPLTGVGEPVPAEVPRWFHRVIQVPVGADQRGRIARAYRVRKIYTGLVVFLASLMLGWLFLDALGVAADPLDAGALPLMVALLPLILIVPALLLRSFQPPRVAGTWLLVPHAHPDVALEIAGLNRPGAVEVG